MKDAEMKDILVRAQEAYGFKNQVSVATEELCELACVLSKYVRYPDHDTASEALRDKILDEVADVNVILNHLYIMFGFSYDEIVKAMEPKLLRLKRWLDTNSEFVQTTRDRTVRTCDNCAYTMTGDITCMSCVDKSKWLHVEG